MENLELILSLAGTVLGLLITVATFVAQWAKSAKAKKVAEQTIEMCNAIIPFVKTAESFVNYSGEEKKEYVLTKVNQYAIEHGLKFDEKLVGEEIEGLVELSKKVNKRDKDTQKIITIPMRQSDNG